MKKLFLAILAISLATAGLTVHTCCGQTVGSPVDPFTGRIVFHQKNSPITYDVTIIDAEVSGSQLLGTTPIAKIIGGWFDYKKSHLSLLIQGTEKDMAPEWRSQCQQFSIDLKTKEVRLEHMLYSYGATLDNPQPLEAAHILDSFDASVRLVE